MSDRATTADEKSAVQRKKKIRTENKPHHESGPRTAHDQIMLLQRTIGNKAAGRLLRPGLIQPKLTVSHPNDIHEQEADRVADEVMRMPDAVMQRQPLEEEEQKVQTKPIATQITPLVQRVAPLEEEEKLQAKANIGVAPSLAQRQPEKEEEELVQAEALSGRTPEVSSKIEGRISALQGGGRPLSNDVRGYMEPRFGADFSPVRIHTDAEAAETAGAVNALAFTVGRDIVFGAGQYAPESKSGKSLLAHELTHVLQQSGGKGPGIQRQEPPKSEPVATTTTPKETTAVVDPAKLSGKKWWDANQGNDPYKKSESISDLASDFQTKVREFKTALDNAGAPPTIDTTKRSAERAYVLHYAWRVAKNELSADKVQAKDTVDIVWNHGDDTKSKAGANEIIAAAAVASRPSLTSNHIDGNAIDWTITWTGDLKIKKKDGTEIEIKSTPRNGGDPGNTELHEVGKSYGVHKGLNFTPKDPPHWSDNGA